MKKLFFLPRVFYPLFLMFCLELAASSSVYSSDRLLFYTIDFHSMRSDGISVKLIYHDESRDEHVFYSIPSWIENPLYPTTLDPLVEISVRDSQGTVLPVIFEPYINGTQVFRFSRGLGGPYQISYTLDFSGFDSYDIDAGPLPHFTDTDGFIYGNYLFVYPYTGNTLAEAYRTPEYDIYVRFETGEDVSLLGVPYKLNPSTPYELIFYQLYLGNVQIYSGLTEGLSYDFVFHHHQPTEDELNYFQNTLPKQIGAVVNYFGTPCASEIFITICEDDSYSGMEAANGFSMEISPEWIVFSDLLNPFTQLVAEIVHHETVHLWIGIRLGELEDPWFKEGVTTYLGLLLAAQSGFITEDYFSNAVLNDQNGNYVIENFALSDPQVRARLFENLLWSNLVYIKGAQVAFLLDLAIRDATGNNKNIRDVLLFLWSHFAPGAFYREELLEGIILSTGFDASGFFQNFIDTPGAISMQELEGAIRTAREYGILRQAGWRISASKTATYSQWMMDQAMYQRSLWLRD